MAPHQLIVLGCGQVGRALLELAPLGKCANKSQQIGVLAVFDSKYGVLPGSSSSGQQQQLSADALGRIAQCKLDSQSLGSLEGALPFEEAWPAALAQCGGEGSRVVVADCTASDATPKLLLEALERPHVGVALANKKPISGPQAQFERLVSHDPRFKWESAVGAGSPFITSFKRLVSGGDKVHKVAGVFSGTLGYVMTGLEDGKKLSDVVVEAKAQGFTEPDPRDDLSGQDFARKALILARMMGWQKEMGDIQLESMVPADLAQDNMPLDQFMATGLQSLDKAMEEKVQAAKAKGAVLRYAATLEGGACKVGIVEVSRDTPLGRLRGTDNILTVDSEIYSPSPLVIQGRGAGPMCTALGVLADAVEIFNQK